MSDVAIRVSNLGKQYRIGALRRQADTLRDALVDGVKGILGGFWSNGHDADNTIWALQDVSFEVKQGEVLGVIGRNGAGKSTLLKILSRITEPTTGEIELHGRVGSLLEVGTGFHAELSGRENIYLNGAIIGMKRREIQRKFDEIVDFAGVDQFIDTPVKHYSSGMYMRLAFAVAAHMETEILLIDEVLAVGDAEFQRKCLGKMGEVARAGRTVLFVSHNMDAVLRLSREAVLLKGGQIQFFGSTEGAVGSYLRGDFGTTALRTWSATEAPRNDVVKLVSVKIHTEQGLVSESTNISKPVGITMDYEVLKPGVRLSAAFNFHNEAGINIFDSHETGVDVGRLARDRGHYTSTVWIPGNFLSEGIVVVGAAVVTPDPFFIHVHENDVVAFNVVDDGRTTGARGDYAGSFPGVVRPLLKWQTSMHESLPHDSA